jgi:nucleotide-binding universal stress UspA family protein
LTPVNRAGRPAATLAFMFSRILVPTDGSRHANRALGVAARLARQTGAVLTVYHAIRLEGTYGEDASFDAERLRAHADAVARRYQLAVEVEIEHSETPAQAIVAAARRTQATAIVMASRGHGGLERFVVGSETQRVLARSSIPVLVVK